MHCKIEIEMDNAAFDPANLELARILREAARRAETLQFNLVRDGFWLRDVNGNRVGHLEIIKED